MLTAVVGLRVGGASIDVSITQLSVPVFGGFRPPSVVTVDFVSEPLIMPSVRLQLVQRLIGAVLLGIWAALFMSISATTTASSQSTDNESQNGGQLEQRTM